MTGTARACFPFLGYIEHMGWAVRGFGLGITPPPYLLGIVSPTTGSPPPPLSLLVMTSKRLWVTTAIVLALSTTGPRSSGVWAQSKPAVCAAGWEWVRFFKPDDITKKRLPVVSSALTCELHPLVE